ncbi:HAD-IA family hydrolase [Primorskyibacter sp. S187A]|uniref:HAD-IA family hydrolase n=1 Tax=Primorskyibacter sp. S187A TaxID=3415130 RepID=UPI003C7B3334
MRIAFDLDGTLVDSITHIHASVSRALEDLILPAIDQPTVQSFVGNGLPEAMRRVLDHLDLSQDLHAALCKATMGHYISLPSDPKSVYPHVTDALAALQAQGHSLSVCTNKPFQAALNVLRDIQLLPYFDLIIGGDSLPNRKPEPQMLTACAPDLYVGDSEVDAATAQAANIPFLLFTEGYRKTPVDELHHDAAFSSYKDFHSFVDKYLPG